jgi:REP element-mobilizing transposase RayT
MAENSSRRIVHVLPKIMTRRPRRPVQLQLPPKGRGGCRPGAGRPKKPGAGVSHLRRPEFPARFPVHITLRVRRQIGGLRRDDCFFRIKRAFRYGHDGLGMRLLEFSIQRDHIHLLVEAEGRRGLSRGMQALAIRLARGVNRALARIGQVFADRYHARILRTLAEVRHAIQYVRKNWHKHQRQYGRWSDARFVDPYSSMSGDACWYVDQRAQAALVVAAPRTWLGQRAAAPP